MQPALECLPCLVRQAAEAVALSEKRTERRPAILKRILRALAETDWDRSSPAMAQMIHQIVREETGNGDPYRSIKKRMNRAALEGMPVWRELMLKSENARETVIRLAAAGNLLDSAAKTSMQPEDIPRLASLWTRPLVGDPHDLFRLADRATQILYLADNAGEIVFDRLLIETLPTEKVTMAVRGGPILNDALMEDAAMAGVLKIASVVSNGSDAPGTILDDCSEEFRTLFATADLIVAKGQGNYETLAEVRAPVVFLFTVKCEIIADRIGKPVGSLIATRGSNWTTRGSTCRSPKNL
ncbi:hypothetical protein TSACC_22297 [Terrimicrobium sacchariphilum]|uniref:Damage-control phosphatase ARMT1-like metal-binding domain-containing protein n=1 Tax=Terrimicrobium sacchariphilum TaxID=690879 RepID=A0A146GAQ7_TERSA|nr:ARMT1-like domain-containing protein [Terrimicrobium sacchariphilum]GAT33877.1 hypothetical protein TSACC_22297 [Terrimicrobium sacchariphilum]